MKKKERSARNYLILESCDLILDALFLCITFFLAARSVNDTAFLIESLVLSFLACLIATSRPAETTLFTRFFLFDPLRALLALFVTGMLIV